MSSKRRRIPRGRKRGEKSCRGRGGTDGEVEASGRTRLAKA